MRDRSGELRPDPNKFTVEMGALVEEVHGMGLKMGLGTDIGPTTRLGRPGSMGYEAQDIETFANWGYQFCEEASTICGSTTTKKQQAPERGSSR